MSSGERVALAVLVAVLIVFLSVAIIEPLRAADTAPDHVRSWSEAVAVGTIQGDASYYYDGVASPAEFHHALITATNQIAADQWVPPPPDATEAVPESFCADRLWEYRDAPGAGYWPQLFADTYTYDSLTLFDDHYGPVTYLNPQAGRVYQHPAGGYDRLIVCMARI